MLGAFAACPRLGYYYYFGGSKRKALSEPQKERIQFLKQLSAGHLVAGEVVHKAIRAYLMNAKEEQIWKLSQVISFANMLLDNAIQHTADITAGVNREYDHRAPAIILELFYGAVTAEILRDDLREKMRVSLEQFYNLPDFQPFRNGSLHENSLIERKISLDYEGILVEGAIDLMYPVGGDWVIVDWKTGENDSEESSLQLLTYALWAHEELGIPLESISLFKAFLTEGIAEPLLFSAQELRRAKARILQDIELLTEMEEFGDAANWEAFSACGQPKVCVQCAFQEICSKK
ncbi:Dna2/Cas4 domain-containing protein [Mucilaginibacter sp. S1162]|uniref:Dna2/Cas4 domain-containing protein n=1 Tax=Mucilaginibacter humi TaxID=2732510 RepID=A0ABX1W1G5_9SPHI|nr:PD-(D/E)XK nuclease family protein [Mucilaginibacter humi]NNU33704.1 Dna2/Cas4 domain-containing protein [Mucilaginibacter humi]